MRIALLLVIALCGVATADTNMMSPEGRVYSIKDDQVTNAIAQGFRRVTPEEDIERISREVDAEDEAADRQHTLELVLIGVVGCTAAFFITRWATKRKP